MCMLHIHKKRMSGCNPIPKFKFFKDWAGFWIFKINWCHWIFMLSLPRRHSYLVADRRVSQVPIFFSDKRQKI